MYVWIFSFQHIVSSSSWFIIIVFTISSFNVAFWAFLLNNLTSSLHRILFVNQLIFELNFLNQDIFNIISILILSTLNTWYLMRDSRSSKSIIFISRMWLSYICNEVSFSCFKSSNIVSIFLRSYLSDKWSNTVMMRNRWWIADLTNY
jgi:hypothetical protein